MTSSTRRVRFEFANLSEGERGNERKISSNHSFWGRTRSSKRWGFGGFGRKKRRSTNQKGGALSKTERKRNTSHVVVSLDRSSSGWEESGKDQGGKGELGTGELLQTEERGQKKKVRVINAAEYC